MTNKLMYTVIFHWQACVKKFVLVAFVDVKEI